MSTEGHLTESRGYLSEESKRRFTLVAGILGALFFLAQLLLPMLVMFLVMMPRMFGGALSIADVDQAALWRDELWFIERTTKLNWRDPENSAAALALRHVRLADLTDAGPALPLDAAATDSSPALLPMGDRLWVIGANTVSYYQNQSLTRLSDASRPARASRPFVYGGRPAVISLGTPPTLATLHRGRPPGGVDGPGAPSGVVRRRRLASGLAGGGSEGTPLSRRRALHRGARAMLSQLP